MVTINFDIYHFVLQKPGGPVLPGKPLGLFLIYSYAALIECVYGVLGH